MAQNEEIQENEETEETEETQNNVLAQYGIYETSDDVYVAKSHKDGLASKMLKAISTTSQKTVYAVRPTYGAANGLQYQISLKIKEMNLPYVVGAKRTVIINGEELSNVVILQKVEKTA